MRIRTRVLVCLAAASAIAFLTPALSPRASADAPVAAAEQQQPSPAAAERLAGMARMILANSQSITPPVLRQASAFLETAIRLSPQDERFLRLQVEASLQLGDTEASIDALQSYRKVQPADCVAQTRLIDLYAVGMETADKKVEYFRKLVDTAGLPVEVRSHAAMSCASALDERGQNTAAEEMVDKALELNALNSDAIMRRWSEVRDDPDASTVKRVGALLQVLRNNPGQPSALALLGWEYAQAGMIDASLRMYAMSFDQSGKRGAAPSPDDLIRYTAELALGEQVKAAETTALSVLAADPANSQFAMLNVLLARRNEDPTKAQPAIRQAQAALESNLKLLHRKLVNKSPSTRPSDVVADAVPDFTTDVEALKAADPQMLDAYAASLADLAWMNIYFSKNPAAASKAIDAIKALQPESPVRNRLEGWSFLLQNKPDEAKVRLTAVADRDLLAKMGMLRLTPQDPESLKAAAVEAQKLLNDNAGGVIALILLDGLKDLSPKIVETTDADVIKQEFARLPKDWLNILDKPQLFYVLRARPLKVSHPFGEPMIAEVTIANTSPYDLSIGDDAVIKSDLWFDAQVKGIAQGSYPGVKYDRLAQATLLKPGQSVSQLTRVDEGNLATILNSNPGPSIPIYFSALTNPVPTSSGIAPGAGGYRVQFTSPVERMAAPMNTQDQQVAVFTKMTNGRADEQIEAVDLVATYVRLLRQQQNATPDKIAAAKGFTESIERLEGVKDASVRGWVRYVLVLISDPEKRAIRHAKMVSSPAWEERIFALAALISLPPAQQRAVTEKLAVEDPDPTVKKLAAAMLETINSATGLQPASQPASKPN